MNKVPLTEKVYIDMKNIPEVEIAPGFYTRLVHTNRQTTSYVRIEGGAELPEHYHENEQITHMIEGQLELIVGGHRKVCQPGDVIVIPPSLPHSAIAHTDCRVIDVFSPPRAEYSDDGIHV